MDERRRGDHTASSEDGPLARRLQRGNAPAPQPTIAPTPEPVAWPRTATLQKLDGNVIARLDCSVEGGVIGIGRGSRADVKINDPYVHRLHAEIVWDATIRAHVITHCGGENGTWVNLQRVTSPTRLADGARVRVGKTELIYYLQR